MMVTPEMMEALGAKRGKARGPNMTNVVVPEGSVSASAAGTTAATDSYGGTASLEDAVGEWGQGLLGARAIRKKKHTRERQQYQAECEKFKIGNARLQVRSTT